MKYIQLCINSWSRHHVSLSELSARRQRAVEFIKSRCRAREACGSVNITKHFAHFAVICFLSRAGFLYHTVKHAHLLHMLCFPADPPDARIYIQVAIRILPIKIRIRRISFIWGWSTVMGGLGDVKMLLIATAVCVALFPCTIQAQGI